MAAAASSPAAPIISACPRTFPIGGGTPPSSSTRCWNGLITDQQLRNRCMRAPMSDRFVSVPPRVSVIMPTFKQARFLRRAIDSLLIQSWTDWELIVVDDGSPDDTQAILAPFLADPRVRGIRFDINQGLGYTLNAGLDASSGNLIAYLPSDDVWYRDHLASMVGLFTSQPEFAMAYSGIR